MVEPGGCLDSTERVSRSAIFPKFYLNSEPVRGFAPEQLLDFQRIDKKDKSRLWTSVAWHLKLNNDREEIHAYGCRLAAKKNERYVERKQVDPKPLVSQCHYLGHYDFSLESIPHIETDAHSVEVVYQPEDGEDSHCNVIIAERSDLAADVDLKDSRATVITRLWRHLVGPYRGLCAVDAEYFEALEAIELKSPN